MCASEVDCEVIVQSGAYWTYWRGDAQLCNCYNATLNPYFMWTPDFPAACAVCVCNKMFQEQSWIELGQTNCYASADVVSYACICVVFLIGFACLAISLSSLKNHALVGKREIKIGKVGLVREKASKNLLAGASSTVLLIQRN